MNHAGRAIRHSWDACRTLLGEEGVEELLGRTIEAAVTLKLIAKKELSRVIAYSAGCVISISRQL